MLAMGKVTTNYYYYYSSYDRQSLPVLTTGAALTDISQALYRQAVDTLKIMVFLIIESKSVFQSH